MSCDWSDGGCATVSCTMAVSWSGGDHNQSVGQRYECVRVRVREVILRRMSAR